ncbi:Pimeloyl-ACP methyl ester carboxylesterase [Amycolatopsis arida]|uniref:Pimeloyl-ACP methyl ester carboxylesterase n=1 Tax=Amycolatopsis arida TaxID=587909 RepID=A0A1I5TJG9_9PSEU|nr:alpha/beta hydrolase [Amycolatopsis arida]TDX96072.1 pimeloyl-ACP methyl ester carboxylesterase [Amycolatopsis arida]SFP83209.1 Pimeloyl-ACP methyl ester carboxylesterase [Amycolatopsis arida]
MITEPARLGTTTLPDGRALGWAEWGPPGGRPVVLCPGAGTSRSLGFGAGVLADLGIRLVSVDRPGLGASDPAPGRTLDDWAADVRHLARARGLGAPAVVGYSQGVPFALACAARGVAAAAAVVCGDELADPRLADRLDAEVRGLVELAAADPARAEAVFAEFGDAERLEEMIVAGSSEVDRAVYTEPGFARAFRRALAEGFRQGPAGYARDTLLSMRRWPFDPAQVTVPVDLWYGRLDASPVHSPDLGATLAARMPAARRHVVDTAGGALLWTHAVDVLRTVHVRLY